MTITGSNSRLMYYLHFVLTKTGSVEERESYFWYLSDGLYLQLRWYIEKNQLVQLHKPR